MTFRACYYKGNRKGVYNLYNRLVRFWTKGKYSHVEIQFSDGISASSSFSDGGVRFASFAYNPEKWDFVELPLWLEKDARAWFEKNKGKRYDTLANIRFAFGFIQEDRNGYMCVEACMTSLGFKDAWRFEPDAAHSVLSWYFNKEK